MPTAVGSSEVNCSPTSASDQMPIASGVKRRQSVQTPARRVARPATRKPSVETTVPTAKTTSTARGHPLSTSSWRSGIDGEVADGDERGSPERGQETEVRGAASAGDAAPTETQHPGCEQQLAAGGEEVEQHRCLAPPRIAQLIRRYVGVRLDDLRRGGKDHCHGSACHARAAEQGRCLVRAVVDHGCDANPRRSARHQRVRWTRVRASTGPCLRTATVGACAPVRENG